MKLMTKVNRAIRRAGWKYSEPNCGDYKISKTQFHVTHEGLSLYLGIELESHVTTPSNSRYFTQADVIRSQKLIHYETASYSIGTRFDLDNFSLLPDWDYQDLLIQDALKHIEWDAQDLQAATNRRNEDVREFQEYFQ